MSIHVIDNHVIVSLFETLSFFQDRLYADLKYVFLHKYYALPLFHKIHTMLQIPILYMLAYTSYKGRCRYQGRIRVLATLHAKVLSLASSVMGNL
jgi:hypothetical protein